MSLENVNPLSVIRCSLLHTNTSATDDKRHKDNPEHAATMSFAVKFGYRNHRHGANGAAATFVVAESQVSYGANSNFKFQHFQILLAR